MKVYVFNLNTFVIDIKNKSNKINIDKLETIK